MRLLILQPVKWFQIGNYKFLMVAFPLHSGRKFATGIAVTKDCFSSGIIVLLVIINNSNFIEIEYVSVQI